MKLSGTEADVISTIARLRKATRSQIRKHVGFSLDYIEFVCRDLIRKNYIDFSSGCYFLTKNGLEDLLSEEIPRIDRKLLREIAGEVAREISSEIKETMGGSKGVVSFPGEDISTRVKIKTDFNFPVEDATLTLKSNIGKIGANREKEKSDIDKSVELFKKIQEGRKNE